MPYRNTVASLSKRWHILPLGVLLTGVCLPQAYAIDNVRRETRHFIECFGLMISDPDAHSDNCLPNRVVLPEAWPTSQSGGSSSLPPPVVVVVPPPVVVAPPVVVPPPVVEPPPPVAIVEPPPPPPAPVCDACYAI